MNVRLLAIVAEAGHRRVYLPADSSHEVIANDAAPTWRPETELPNNPRDFKTPNYGLTTFADLFTNRQLVTLTTLSDLVSEARNRIYEQTKHIEAEDTAHGAKGAYAEYAEAVATYLAIGVNKMTDYNCTLVTWIMQRDQAGHAFTKQALPMVWDFTEVNPLVGAAGSHDCNLRPPRAPAWSAAVTTTMATRPNVEKRTSARKHAMKSTVPTRMPRQGNNNPLGLR